VTSGDDNLAATEDESVEGKRPRAETNYSDSDRREQKARKPGGKNIEAQSGQPGERIAGADNGSNHGSDARETAQQQQNSAGERNQNKSAASQSKVRPIRHVSDSLGGKKSSTDQA